MVTDLWVRRAIGLPGGDPSVRYPAIATDTRTLVPGSLFVALVGERFDGHRFLPDARDRGAAGAVVREGTPVVGDLRWYEVPDPLEAYGRLARARRREVAGPIVAITGTNGKTAVKEMIAVALDVRFRTHATRLNRNNLVGVPQTILEAPLDTEALVIEAGASVRGEMSRYREIVEPDIAVVTNVGPGHLEGFGSVPAVMAEKLELVRGVALVVVGTDPDILASEARARGARRVIRAGLGEADLTPDSVELDALGRPVMTIEGQRVRLPLVGMHQAGNAMLAWAVVREVGVDAAAAARALAGVRVPGGRGEIVQVGRMTVLNDCYNANPASFEAAIRMAERLRSGRRLVFVAGTMRELGAESAVRHREVAQRLAALQPDLLAVVGDFVPALAPFAGELGDRLVAEPDPLALAPRLAERLRGDEVVVLKASRGVALERILPTITGRAALAPNP